MHRAIISSLLTLAVPSIGPGAPGNAVAAASVIRVTVTISGGYHFKGTWTSTGPTSNNGCRISNLSGTSYSSSYHSGLFKSLELIGNAFSMTERPYRPGSRLQKPTSYEVGVILKGRAFIGESSTPSATPVKLTLHIARGGASGSLTAINVPAWTGKDFASHRTEKYHVTIQAHWTCGVVSHVVP